MFLLIFMTFKLFLTISHQCSLLPFMSSIQRCVHTNPITGEALNGADNGSIKHIRDNTAIFLLMLVLWWGKCGHCCEKERNVWQNWQKWINDANFAIKQKYLSCVQGLSYAILMQLLVGCSTV